MHKIGRIGMWFFLIFMFLFQFPSQAQNKKYFVINGSIVPEEKKSETGSIEITKNGKEASKIDIPKNGRFRFELEFFNEYILTFKYPGHFNKIIVVSTVIPQEVWKRDNEFPPFPMVVQLLKEFEGIDKSFTLKPSGRIFYGKDIDNFEKESYISDIQFIEQIETAKSQANKVQKEAQSISKENAQELAAKQKNFDQLLKEADAYYQRGEYKMALMKYLEAKRLFPEKAYPNDRVAELQDLVKALENTEKQKTELDQKYKAVLAKANEFFDKKSYPEARPGYEEALQYKPGDVFANGRISEIDQFLALLEKQKQYNDLVSQADSKYKSKNYDQAVVLYNQAKQTVPGEQYPQIQIDLITQEKLQQVKREQLEKNFNLAIQTANMLSQKKDYLQALDSYKNALSLKPDSKLAKDKIAETELSIVAVETDKKYQDAIRLADQAMTVNDTQKAKLNYQEALKIKPAEAYPKTKLAEIAETESREIKFNGLIANAEKAYSIKNLDEAVNLFSQALELKPKNQAVQQRIDDIQNLRKLQLTDKEYTDILAQADMSFRNDQLDASLSAYNRALLIKKTEPYPKDQIKRIETYQSLIRKADKLFGSKDYTGSLGSLNEALAQKPNDSYATGRITEINNILAEKKKLEDRANAELLTYNEAIKNADQLFTAKSYPESLNKYKEAANIKVSEAYPKKRIKEIETILDGLEKDKARNEKQDLAFSQAMAGADKAFSENDFNSAKTDYQTALSIKPDDRLAKEKLGQTEAKLAQLVKMTQAYNKAISEANRHLTDKQYKEAKGKYLEALQYLSDSDYPKQQITKIDEVLAQHEAETKTRQEFNLAVAEGESLLKNKDLPKAKDAFTKAYTLIPSEILPPKRISEINAMMTDQARKDSELKANMEAYVNAIQRADKHFGNKEYTSAQLVYNEALLVKPDERYPVDQLALIEKLLKEQKEQNYKTAIAKADNTFNSNELDESASSYNEALSYKKNDPYATQRLKEIDVKKAQAEIENNRLRKLQEQYDVLMADASKDLGNKEYQKSKEKYQRASGLKPDEVLPKEQIAKIDQILNGLQKEAETNRQYVQLIKAAQESFGQNKLKDARDSYQKASGLKPSEPLPPLRIAEIDKMLGQLEETAKLAAMEEAQRLAKEKADRTQYDNAIAAGDKSFGEKQYNIARTQYTTALTALPNEKYPRVQIAKIDDLLSQEDMKKALALQKAQIDSIQKVKDKSYDLAMITAKEHAQNKRYPQAIQKYHEAIALNPSQRNMIQKLIRDIEDQIQLLTKQETEYKRIIKLADGFFAQSKLNEALIEYRNAVAIKTNEEYPKIQIREIQSTLTAREESYANAIKNADKAYDASDWPNAKTAYTEALSIKSNEAYPLNRLKEVNRKITDANLSSISNSAEDKAYQEALEKAEKAVKEEQFSTAHMQFELAKTLKPTEKLPVTRLKEIDLLIDQRNKERLVQSQREIDEKYRQAISIADNSFREKKYPIAKLQYNQALIVKPDESYPKNQMALIDKLMNEAKPVEIYTNQLPAPKSAEPVATAVYNPVESAQEIESRAQSFNPIANYDEAIKKADDSFGIKDYSVARFFYLRASEFKPKEKYPKSQIELIRKLIDSQLSANDVSGYENAITQADAAFVSKNYTIAKFFYYKAIDIKSWEKYPKDRINEILALTHSLLSEKEEKEYRDVIAKADEAYFNKDVAIARFYYNKAISIKKEENYPRIKLKDIEKLIDQDKRDQENQAYRKLIEQADQALQAENFSIARFNYNKALGLKPDEKYPKDQLKRIRETLSKPHN